MRSHGHFKILGHFKKINMGKDIQIPKKKTNMYIFHIYNYTTIMTFSEYV